MAALQCTQSVTKVNEIYYQNLSILQIFYFKIIQQPPLTELFNSRKFPEKCKKLLKYQSMGNEAYSAFFYIASGKCRFVELYFEELLCFGELRLRGVFSIREGIAVHVHHYYYINVYYTKLSIVHVLLLYNDSGFSTFKL